MVQYLKIRYFNLSFSLSLTYATNSWLNPVDLLCFSHLSQAHDAQFPFNFHTIQPNISILCSSASFLRDFFCIISASHMCLPLPKNSSRPFETLCQLEVIHVHGFSSYCPSCYLTFLCCLNQLILDNSTLVKQKVLRR